MENIFCLVGFNTENMTEEDTEGMIFRNFCAVSVYKSWNKFEDRVLFSWRQFLKYKFVKCEICTMLAKFSLADNNDNDNNNNNNNNNNSFL